MDNMHGLLKISQAIAKTHHHYLNFVQLDQYDLLPMKSTHGNNWHSNQDNFIDIFQW